AQAAVKRSPARSGRGDGASDARVRGRVALRSAALAAYRINLRLRRRKLRKLRHRARGQSREHSRVAGDGGLPDNRPQRRGRDLLYRGAPSPRRQIHARGALFGRLTRGCRQGSNPMAKKIFLAGATGAVGRRMLPLLRAAGYEVTGSTRAAAKT